jgi:radical SAM superfamily enzyme YgiQ (UPF0313 family)
MRVLLVNPGYRRNRVEAVLPPLGLAFLAAAVRGRGDEVRILDLNLDGVSGEALTRMLHQFQPHLVGITAMTLSYNRALALAVEVGKVRPGTGVVMGGVQATINPEQPLKDGPVDWVVYGEGEATLVELLEHLSGGRALATIPGLAWRDGHRVAVNPARPPLGDLDSLPVPAYDLLEMHQYSSPQSFVRPLAAMFTSRGCPFHCTFCDAHLVHGRSYRYHSPARVVEEMAYLKARFGVRQVVFKDSEFTLNRRRTEGICDQLLELKLGLVWSCNSRAETVDLALLRKMKAAGCRLIQVGVESGSQSILDNLKKKLTVEQIKEAFRAARQAGIRTVANCMVGLPGETREDFAKTLALVKKIKADYLNVNFITPFPGTELYRQALAQGWFLGKPEKMQLRQDECVMNATKLDLEELRGLKSRLERGFYLRPAYIMKRALTLNPREWKTYLAGARVILGFR